MELPEKGSLVIMDFQSCTW